MVYDYDGRRIEVPSRRRMGSHSLRYHLMEEPFRQGGALAEGRFGDARTYTLDTRRAGDITYALLKRKPLFFSKSFQETKA